MKIKILTPIELASKKRVRYLEYLDYIEVEWNRRNKTRKVLNQPLS